MSVCSSVCGVTWPSSRLRPPRPADAVCAAHSREAVLAFPRPWPGCPLLTGTHAALPTRVLLPQRCYVSCCSVSISLGLLLLPLPLPGIQAFFPGPEAGPPPGPDLLSPDPALQATKLLPYMTNLFNRLIVPELSQKKWQLAMSPLCCETEVNVVKQVKKKTSRTQKPGEGWPEGGEEERKYFLAFVLSPLQRKTRHREFLRQLLCSVKVSISCPATCRFCECERGLRGMRRSPWWGSRAKE